MPDASGVYSMPPAVNSDLSKNADGTWVIKFRQSGQTWKFDAGGELVSAVGSERPHDRLRVQLEPAEQPADAGD